MSLQGFLFINKPAGVSSYDCVRYIKKLLPPRTKIGHTGTLDVFASGLLIICIGRGATKQSQTLLDSDKAYVVKAKLGELTDTLDYTGIVTQTVAVPAVTKDELVTAMHSLQPSYLQVPPVFSALKHKGQPLYKLARTKQLSEHDIDTIAQQKARIVSIYTIDLIAFEPPFFSFNVFVSKGTYVRSLANDIAQKLGIPATTYQLERTKIGSALLTEAIALHDFKNYDDVVRAIKTEVK